MENMSEVVGVFLQTYRDKESYPVYSHRNAALEQTRSSCTEALQLNQESWQWGTGCWEFPAQPREKTRECKCQCLLKTLPYHKGTIMT